MLERDPEARAMAKVIEYIAESFKEGGSGSDVSVVFLPNKRTPALKHFCVTRHQSLTEKTKALITTKLPGTTTLDCAEGETEKDAVRYDCTAAFSRQVLYERKKDRKIVQGKSRQEIKRRITVMLFIVMLYLSLLLCCIIFQYSTGIPVWSATSVRLGSLSRKMGRLPYAIFFAVVS